MGSRLRNTKVSIREKWPLSGFYHCQHLLPSPQPNQTSSVLRRMDTLRTLTNVTNTMTAMTEFQRSVSAQMVLFLIHIQERESLAITISTYDCGDRLDLQPPKGPSDLCPRLNGFYSHPDPSVCHIFYACVA